ncbi:hypothetical protein TNCV_3784961 [Trichonephila clavipes]|nr:hypothetical protein TNCV_3784961 [Trichonephila clavipes]
MGKKVFMESNKLYLEKWSKLTICDVAKLFSFHSQTILENTRPADFSNSIDSDVTSTLERFFSHPPPTPISPTNPDEVAAYVNKLKVRKTPGLFTPIRNNTLQLGDGGSCQIHIPETLIEIEKSKSNSILLLGSELAACEKISSKKVCSMLHCCGFSLLL